MPKTPASLPSDATPCDTRLTEAALNFRLHYPPPLTTDRFLNGFNITSWLYKDAAGEEHVHVAVNTTIDELKRKFGPAETPDAEVGFHSEMMAAEWFRNNRGLRVVQVFSERIPCPKMCGPMLRTYYPNIPWYYYYDRRSWIGANGKPMRSPAESLKTAYGL